MAAATASGLSRLVTTPKPCSSATSRKNGRSFAKNGTKRPSTIALNRNSNLALLRVGACLAVVLLHTSADHLYLWRGRPAFLELREPRQLVDALVCISLRDDQRCLDRVQTNRATSRIHVPPRAHHCGAHRRLDRRLSVVEVSLLRRAFHRSVGREGGLFRPPYYHLYFLFLIGGFYVFAPPLAAAISILPRSQSLVMSGLALAFASITLTAQGLNSNALTFFVPYLGYFALGALLLDARVRPGPTAALFACAVLITAALTFVVVSKRGVNSRWGLYFYSYSSPTVLIMAPAVFCLFNSLRVPVSFTRWLTAFVPLTLGIYLVHPIVLETLRWQWGRFAPALLRPILDIPITFVLTVIISAAFVGLVRCIPIVRLAV